MIDLRKRRKRDCPSPWSFSFLPPHPLTGSWVTRAHFYQLLRRSSPKACKVPTLPSVFDYLVSTCTLESLPSSVIIMNVKNKIKTNKQTNKNPRIKKRFGPDIPVVFCRSQGAHQIPPRKFIREMSPSAPTGVIENFCFILPPNMIFLRLIIFPFGEKLHLGIQTSPQCPSHLTLCLAGGLKSEMECFHFRTRFELVSSFLGALQFST